MSVFFSFFSAGACASDRSIILYDMRESVPLRKVVMKMRSNTIAWNPMEAFVFTAASEDYKCGERHVLRLANFFKTFLFVFHLQFVHVRHALAQLPAQHPQGPHFGRHRRRLLADGQGDRLGQLRQDAAHLRGSVSFHRPLPSGSTEKERQRLIG